MPQYGEGHFHSGHQAQGGRLRARPSTTRLTERVLRLRRSGRKGRKRRHLSRHEALQISSFHFAKRHPAVPQSPLHSLTYSAPSPAREVWREIAVPGMSVSLPFSLPLPLPGIIAISLYLRAGRRKKHRCPLPSTASLQYYRGESALKDRVYPQFW